jgi:hypothetical protein
MEAKRRAVQSLVSKTVVAPADQAETRMPAVDGMKQIPDSTAKESTKVAHIN